MSSSSTSDTAVLNGNDILQEIMNVLDDILEPMHFLKDLNAVWDKLSDEEREDIENSRVYKENDHDQRIKSNLDELQDLCKRLRGFKYRGARKIVRQYIAHWKTFEPDQIKILQAQIKQHMN